MSWVTMFKNLRGLCLQSLVYGRLGVNPQTGYVQTVVLWVHSHAQLHLCLQVTISILLVYFDSFNVFYVYIL